VKRFEININTFWSFLRFDIDNVGHYL